MSSQFVLSLASGAAISGAAGYLGALLLQKRMALSAGPLGHLALPGVALALIYGFDIALGAFPFIILGIILIWALEIKTKLPTESLTAVVFATGVGVSFLFLPIEDAEAALIGNIINIGPLGAALVLFFSFSVFFVVKKIFSRMLLINISEDLARVKKINIKRYNLVFLLSLAIIVALGVRLVGGLLTAALVAIPASTARNLSGSIKAYAFLSCIIGSVSAVIGLFVYKITGLPAGILIILTSSSIFLISAFFNK